jgi:hypothetical protein
LRRQKLCLETLAADAMLDGGKINLEIGKLEKSVKTIHD